jgi:hypothetical protein
VARPRSAILIRCTLALIAAGICAGCYPIHKTIQPKARIEVLDGTGKPIRAAKASLVSRSHPHKRLRSINVAHTNDAGIAEFPELNDWRVEVLMIHGADVYFWEWCVQAEGFQTYATGNGTPDEFSESARIALQPGTMQACPDYR